MQGCTTPKAHGAQRMALNSPSTPGWQDGAGALRHGARGVQGETQTRREGLGALSPGIWRMGSSETVLTARLGRAGARQQPSPARGVLLAGSSPPTHSLAASEPSTAQGTGSRTLGFSSLLWDPGRMGLLLGQSKSLSHCLSCSAAPCLSFPTDKGKKNAIKPHCAGQGFQAAG